MARVVPNFTNAIKVGALSTAGTAVVAAAVFFLGWPAHISAQPPNGELQSPPEVTMKSTSETMVSCIIQRVRKLYQTDDWKFNLLTRLTCFWFHRESLVNCVRRKLVCMAHIGAVIATIKSKGSGKRRLA